MHISDKGRARTECVREEYTHQREGNVDAGVYMLGWEFAPCAAGSEGDGRNDGPEPASRAHGSWSEHLLPNPLSVTSCW